MAVLWLRFLTEIAEDTIEAPAELLENEATRKALELVEKSTMTEGQLYAYEKFWLAVVDERILREAATKKGYNEGMQKGLEKGLEKGRIEEKLENARNLKNNGVSIDLIAKSLGLPPEEIEHL
jgi:predicted transposase/invertase (TIGR01784 family)